MGIINENNQIIDVICQYTKDGKIIPMRLRLQDADGIYHEFNVRGYRELTYPGKYKSPYGTITHSHTWTFECKIQILDQIKYIELMFNAEHNLWRVAKIH